MTSDSQTTLLPLIINQRKYGPAVFSKRYVLPKPWGRFSEFIKSQPPGKIFSSNPGPRVLWDLYFYKLHTFPTTFDIINVSANSKRCHSPPPPPSLPPGKFEKIVKSRPPGKLLVKSQGGCASLGPLNLMNLTLLLTEYLQNHRENIDLLIINM